MRALSILEALLPAVAGLVLFAIVGEIWVARAAYPFDLEWMEGGMLAHAWRIQQGLPLYVPPGPDFAPFIYPPGYSAVVAAAGSITGLHPAVGRLVSIVAILLAAGAIVFGVRRERGSWVVASGAAITFLGAYPLSGGFYDLVRPDSLAIALMAWSIVLSLRPRRGAPTAAGLLLAAAFLCKHNLALFGVPMVVGPGSPAAGETPPSSRARVRGPRARSRSALLQWDSGGHFLTLPARGSAFPRDDLAPRRLRHPGRAGHRACRSRSELAGWAAVPARPHGLRRQPGMPTSRWPPRPPWCVAVGVAWAGTYTPPHPDSGPPARFPRRSPTGPW